MLDTVLKRDILIIIIGTFSEQINELAMSLQNVSIGEIVLNSLNIQSVLASTHY